MGAAAPVKKPTAQERLNAEQNSHVPVPQGSWTSEGVKQEAIRQNQRADRRDAAVKGLEALADPNDPKALANYRTDAVYQTADQVEAKLQARRRQLASTNTPDAADLAIRDLTTGRARRARGGSSTSALGSFSVSAPMGTQSILGGA